MKMSATTVARRFWTLGSCRASGRGSPKLCRPRKGLLTLMGFTLNPKPETLNPKP